MLADLIMVTPRKQTQTCSNTSYIIFSHIFVVLLYPVANTIASNEIFLLHWNSTMLPLILLMLLSTYMRYKKNTLISWHIKSTYVISLCHVKDILTLMMPFLINPTVPTSITADRPISNLSVIGPIFGLVMPCCDRSPNIKYAAITRSLSTRFNGRRWASVIPKRINSFVITWICNNKTRHTSFEVCMINKFS